MDWLICLWLIDYCDLKRTDVLWVKLQNRELRDIWDSKGNLLWGGRDETAFQMDCGKSKVKEPANIEVYTYIMAYIRAYYVTWWIIYYITAHFAAFNVARSVILLDSTLFVPVQSVWKDFSHKKALYLYFWKPSIWKVFLSHKKTLYLYLIREPSWATSGWKPSEVWHWKENFVIIIIITITRPIQPTAGKA